MTSRRRVDAWELKRHLLLQMRKMKFLYKALVIVFFIICLAIAGHVIFYYNYLTDLRFNVLTEKGKISSAIQYRKNLAPVIIDGVASFVEHEDNVFNRTVDARERELTLSDKISEQIKEAKKLPVQDVFQRILAIGEQYPSIMTSEAFQLMMKQVADAEAKILDYRTMYNDAVNLYTTAMSMFPGNVYASIFSFPTYEYFEDQMESEWPSSEMIQIEKYRKNQKSL